MHRPPGYIHPMTSMGTGFVLVRRVQALGSASAPTHPKGGYGTSMSPEAKIERGSIHLRSLPCKSGGCVSRRCKYFWGRGSSLPRNSGVR